MQNQKPTSTQICFINLMDLPCCDCTTNYMINFDTILHNISNRRLKKPQAHRKGFIIFKCLFVCFYSVGTFDTIKYCVVYNIIDREIMKFTFKCKKINVHFTDCCINIQLTVCTRLNPVFCFMSISYPSPTAFSTAFCVFLM